MPMATNLCKRPALLICGVQDIQCSTTKSNIPEDGLPMNMT